MGTQRFKFLSARVQKVPARAVRFRTQSQRLSEGDHGQAGDGSWSSAPERLPVDQMLALCTNQTQKQIVGLLRHRSADPECEGWAEVHRQEIRDIRTGGAVTQGSFEQALQRLSGRGLMQVRGAGDSRQIRIVFSASPHLA